MFMGGLGLGTKFILERVPKNADPLGKDNIIAIITGPMTGTGVPLSGRYHLVTKSPLTGGIGDANSGGDFGAYLRFTGWDGLILNGVSPYPIYLYISDGDVKFHDAHHLWGKGVYYTEDKIRKELNVGSKGSILSIGPAGENLSLIASIMNDKNRAAARGGVGAVMGSKKVKAIYVKPHTRPYIHDKDRFNEVVKEKNKIVMDNILSQSLQVLGTEAIVNIVNEFGGYPTKNFHSGIFEYAYDVSGETLAEKYLVGNKGCWGCVIRCARLIKVDEKPWQTEYEGAEYEGVWSLGANNGISNLAAINKAYSIVNDMGLDVISYGATVAAAMELYEKGLIPDERLDGLRLEWGNEQAILELAWKTGYRNGFGDDIALGSYRLCEKYGDSSISMSVKKMEMPAYDPRAFQGMGLGYATSNRGGCHLRAYVIPSEVFGVPYKTDPLSIEGKAKLVKMLQDYYAAAIDSGVVCKFNTFSLTPRDFVDIIVPLTGWDIDEDELLLIGERIYNLGRLFNVREGVIDDTLPDRLLKEPLSEGPAKGRVVDLEPMLREYYELRGWKDGIPTKKTLSRLGIEKYGHGINIPS
jgi:aldehyde:ferredoxin oxidoreductase